MENLNQQIENHYFKESLFEDIIKRLTDQHIDLNQIKRSVGHIDLLDGRSFAWFQDVAHAFNFSLAFEL